MPGRLGLPELTAWQHRRRFRRQFHRRDGHPDLDGLGVHGADMHTLNEYIVGRQPC